MPKFILKISSDDDCLINNDHICCYLADKTSAPQILEEAKASDKLVLACDENAAEFCLQADLDGVLIEKAVDEKFEKYVKQIQKQIGVKKFWGVTVNTSRHEAMLASEAEPQFVAFRIEPDMVEEGMELLEWYAELFLIQSALVYDKNLPEAFWEKTDFLILNNQDYKILVDKIKRLD